MLLDNKDVIIDISADTYRVTTQCSYNEIKFKSSKGCAERMKQILFSYNNVIPKELNVTG